MLLVFRLPPDKGPLFGFRSFLCAGLYSPFMNWRWLTKIAATNRPWRLWAGLAMGGFITLTLLSLPIDSR